MITQRVLTRRKYRILPVANGEFFLSLVGQTGIFGVGQVGVLGLGTGFASIKFPIPTSFLGDSARSELAIKYRSAEIMKSTE